jgi:predicted nucleic acid-binding Zn ribbon protein
MPEQLFPCPACGNPCARDVVACRVCACQIKQRKDRARGKKKFLWAMGLALVLMFVSVYFTFLRPRRSPVPESGSLPSAESARSPLPAGQPTPETNRTRKKR